MSIEEVGRTDTNLVVIVDADRAELDLARPTGGSGVLPARGEWALTAYSLQLARRANQNMPIMV